MKVRDFMEVEAEVGDVVVFTLPKFTELQVGTVIKVNPKSVTIEYSNYGDKKKVVRYPNQFVIYE